MTKSHLVWLSLSPAGEEGPPMHSTIWYLSLQQSYISSSFFLRNKTPFLVLIVCCSEFSNWYNCGQSRYCICVCVRVRYVWILRKAAWYFIFKLWLLLHSPTYNGFTPEGWILFWYQFSKKNKAMQANTTKRTGAKFSPKDFLSLVKKQDHRKIKPSVSFQLPAPVFLWAAEYCTNSSTYCAFWDFSIFIYLFIFISCWNSANFPQLRNRPICGSVLTDWLLLQNRGSKWESVSPYLKAEFAMDLQGLGS